MTLSCYTPTGLTFAHAKTKSPDFLPSRHAQRFRGAASTSIDEFRRISEHSHFPKRDNTARTNERIATSKSHRSRMQRGVAGAWHPPSQDLPFTVPRIKLSAVRSRVASPKHDARHLSQRLRARTKPPGRGSRCVRVIPRIFTFVAPRARRRHWRLVQAGHTRH